MHLTRPAKTKSTTESKSRKLILNTYLHERGKMLANASFFVLATKSVNVLGLQFYYYYYLYLSRLQAAPLILNSHHCLPDLPLCLRQDTQGLVQKHCSSECQQVQVFGCKFTGPGPIPWQCSSLGTTFLCVLNGSSPLFRKPTCKCSSFQPKGREQLPYCQTHFCSSGDVLIVLF